MLLSSSFTSISFPSPKFTLRPNRSPFRILKMAQSAQNPVDLQQKIIVPNKHGEKVVGVLHDTRSGLLVGKVYQPMSLDFQEATTVVNIAVALGNEGISSFRFDFAGNGESEGTFQYGNYRREADDLHAVIQHFNGANRAPSAILGHSKGKHDLSSKVKCSGRYDLKKGIEERLGKDYMEGIKKEGYSDVKNKNG